MPKSYDSLKQKITNAIATPEKNAVLLRAMKRGRDARKDQIATLESPEAFREEIKEIKTRSISNLDTLLETFSSKLKEGGCHVYFAATGEDVVNYILRIVEDKGITLAEKSKSLTTEEIELNHHLEFSNKDLKVVETDLGERIIQLANEKPFHLVFPAVHKTQKQVAELFSSATGEEVPDDLQAIMSAVRKHLRPIFIDSQLGITGANVGVAETGSILVETNEGNARLVSAVPDTHVVVIGMEKVVGTWEEALELVMAHPISATGTRLTNYVSIVSGRLPFGGEKHRELHVIIMDNGRSKMRADPWFKEALSCIRCGACMNICPTYGAVGGHVFGYIYPGPIGIPWTEEIHGLEKASEFAPLCISCGLCKEICPAEIDIPMMIAKVKERDVQKNGQITPNKVLSQSDRFAKLASSTAPLSNALIQSRPFRSFMSTFLGIERKRPMPRFTRNTLEKRFVSIKKEISSPSRKVVYFADIVANYNQPEIGLKAVDLLQRSRIDVILPKELQSSGMPYVSYGELKKARKIAEENVRILSPLVGNGYDVVATEPTAAYCLKEVYPKLLDFSDESIAVSKNSYEYFEYLANYCSDLRLEKTQDGSAIKNIGFHIPCHERALSAGRYTISTLETAGYDVKVIETGTCCGMAGTFGLKKGPLGYDLSMAVGRPLFDLFNGEKSISLIATESSVCSTQLTDGTKFQLVHPLELLEAA